MTTSLHSERGTARVATTTSTAHLQESDDESDHGEHTGQLTPARSAELGLQGPGRATPLTEQLWSNPQAIAARFVLVDTTYSASEDAAAVNARRSAYATPRLTADLATPPSAVHASRTCAAGRPSSSARSRPSAPESTPAPWPSWS